MWAVQIKFGSLSVKWVTWKNSHVTFDSIKKGDMQIMFKLYPLLLLNTIFSNDDIQVGDGCPGWFSPNTFFIRISLDIFICCIVAIKVLTQLLQCCCLPHPTNNRIIRLFSVSTRNTHTKLCIKIFLLSLFACSMAFYLKFSAYKSFLDNQTGYYWETNIFSHTHAVLISQLENFMSIH